MRISKTVFAPRELLAGAKQLREPSELASESLPEPRMREVGGAGA